MPSSGTQTPECTLLLHVDDVQCLVMESYLKITLEPALRNKFEISEVLKNLGDEDLLSQEDARPVE